MLSRRTFLLAASGVGAACVCPPRAALAQGAAGPARIAVVASFSILGDFVRVVGGDRVALSVLVGPGGDAHVYAPTPQDARAVAAAKLVVVNGLGFEGWMQRLVAASGSKARVVVATRDVRPLRRAVKGQGDTQADRHGHEHGDRIDPHAWQSVANAKLYVGAIADALASVDPAGKADYGRNAQAYLAQLDALEREVRAAMEKIPPARRKIITTHDAFGYFGAAYGLTLIAPQGVSTESEASAADVARIIRQIRAEKALAVFLENVADPRLAERIAAETGARVGGALYSDSLSPPDGPAGTYIDMVRHNIRMLSAALDG